ncbi:MAG TPA: TolC family protein [Solimonas sp.]|nr:TolC family protein [Solimonas sp.]
MSFHRLIPATLCASLLAAGCSSLPADLGRADVARELSSRGLTMPDATARDDVRAWLAVPLSLDRAIQIALLRNPQLRAETARLGFAAADVYEAGRLANPLLSATWLAAGDEPHAQLTLGIAVNFTDLLFVRARATIADTQFEHARLVVGNAALDLATDVEKAYRRVAAAERQRQLQATLMQAAQTSATFAQRYFAAGNLKRRELALEQAAATQAALDADRAQLAVELARSDFSRVLGLAIDERRWTLAEPLAAPPAQEDAPATLVTLALDNRLDLAAARRHADAVAQRYGLHRKTQWLDGATIGAEREREYDGGAHGGASFGLALPLFDWGRGRRARGEAELRIAEAGIDARRLDVIRDVDAATARVTEARQRVERYRTQLIPAREQVVEQTQRELHYMLVDIFELLAARRQADLAYGGYLDALRDYWLARADLARAIGRRLPGTPDTANADPFTPPSAADDASAAMPMHPEHHPAAMPATGVDDEH